MATTETVRNVSADVAQRVFLPERSWADINEPGAYVEIGSGDLYRIPKEALGPASPLIAKESMGASRLIQISKNPFVTTLQARLLTCEHNVEPNF